MKRQKNDRRGGRIREMAQNHERDISERICRAGRRKKTAGQSSMAEGTKSVVKLGGMKYGKEWNKRRTEIGG